MQIKVREKCDVCNGDGYVTIAATYIREETCLACDGECFTERWIDVKDFLSLITDTPEMALAEQLFGVPS